MKKIVSLTIVLMLGILILAACATPSEQTTPVALRRRSSGDRAMAVAVFTAQVEEMGRAPRRRRCYARRVRAMRAAEGTELGPHFRIQRGHHAAAHPRGE